MGSGDFINGRGHQSVTFGFETSIFGGVSFSVVEYLVSRTNEAERHEKYKKTQRQRNKCLLIIPELQSLISKRCPHNTARDEHSQLGKGSK